jgi:DNA-binding response OmpR family regulator
VTPGSESSSRILVVDDDEQIRKLLTDLLTHDGFEVDAAENAQAALNLLLKHRYSLLTTDLDLPGPSGLDLIREVRGRGLLLPILVLSGDREAVLQAAVQDLGRAECLLKPFALDALRAAVERLLTPQKADRSDSASAKRQNTT